MMQQKAITEKRLLTVHEVAAFLRSTPASIYDKVKRRVIPYLKLGRSVRFDADQIKAWLQKYEIHEIEKEVKSHGTNISKGRQER